MAARRTALVIGGTGPTGPHIVQGLLDRSYDVTILHRGTHEPPDLPEVPHIHADPHFEETLREALGTTDYDLVLGMYGRAAVVASVLAGRCEDYVSISGVPVYVGYNHPHIADPFGMAIFATEESRLVDTLDVDDDSPIALTFAQKILATERKVAAHQPNATIFRYPAIYGPRNIIPWEWSVVKRVLDQRPWMLLPDHGLAIHSRCAAENAAHAILLALDQPAAARGQVFNVADDQQFSLRQWVEIISAAAGRRLPIRSVPSEVAPELLDAVMPQAGDITPHSLIGTQKLHAVLGYRDLVVPREAIERSARWYVEHPVLDITPYVAFFDRFEYAREDELVARYERLVTTMLEELPGARPAPIHAQAHPARAGVGDERGR